MSETAIRVEGLGKQYRIGARQEQYRTLRDTLSETARLPFRKLRSLAGTNGNHRSAASETIWALHDVSFEVKRGEVVGIIGRNGAGKSTVLKILSRITEPTEGFAEIHGRVGSLLEVGTGFHPELTGRDNIYLNGAILGMKRAEIDRKFDEMVAFAEVEKFIDTPVKHYSSGMYLRLAFSVAAHLDPEILLVDEVLAVGDAAFQKKCLGKMGDVAQEGRTVLFVSHNLGQMRRLCKEGMWLSDGRCRQHGSIESVSAAYQKTFAPLADNGSCRVNGHNGFLSWKIVDSPPNQPAMLLTDSPFVVEFLFRLKESVATGHFGVVLQSSDGSNVAGWTLDGVSLRGGLHKLVCKVPHLPVRPGVYFWYVSLWDGAKRVDATRVLPEFVVATQDHSGLSDDWAGPVNVPCSVAVE